MKQKQDEKLDPVTAAIREILKGGHPDWIVVPRDYIERLAKEHNIDVRKLHIAPLKTIFGDEEDK